MDLEVIFEMIFKPLLSLIVGGASRIAQEAAGFSLS